jgi:hypothetical protein
MHGDPQPLYLPARGERSSILHIVEGQQTFEWTEEADKVFTKLKEFLTKPPIMTTPQDDQMLLIYIATTPWVISTAIIVKQEEVRHVYKVQRPMYFISEVLNESKTRYPQVQKLLYAILITSRKLCHYFDYYKIAIISEHPLGDILCNKDANGWISKWAVELDAFSIEYRSRPTIKS